MPQSCKINDQTTNKIYFKCQIWEHYNLFILGNLILCLFVFPCKRETKIIYEP